MSRIGKAIITIPAGVTIQVSGNTVTVKGTKGELSHTLNEGITLKVTDQEAQLSRVDETKEMKALHGLNRSLVANMVIGVNKGFEKQLEIIGVGYRANVKGSMIELSLGFSHPIKYKVAEGVTVEQDKDKKNILTIRGIDKQSVGQVAAEIRAFKKPEPYKGKGIRYVGEHVRRKAGKAAGSA